MYNLQIEPPKEQVYVGLWLYVYRKLKTNHTDQMAGASYHFYLFFSWKEAKIIVFIWKKKTNEIK